jgi:hypothetical protein
MPTDALLFKYRMDFQGILRQSTDPNVHAGEPKLKVFCSQ